MQLESFDIVNRRAIESGDYSDLNLSTVNEISLSLLIDGKAVVLVREGGAWVVIGSFDPESHFTGGHWSDLDIDEACQIFKAWANS